MKKRRKQMSKGQDTLARILRYIAGTLIMIVGLVEMLKIIGIQPDMRYDILKAIILMWFGIFVAFYTRYAGKQKAD
ncbi:hypothetical protein ACFLTD_05600 [Elusimicrobiota bacterium]